MVGIIDSFLEPVAREVFGTMANLAIENVAAAGTAPAPNAFELRGISGCIGFGGRMTGTLFFSVPEKLATQMAHTILGDMCAIGEREVSDAIGELTNMLAGGCKSRLCDQGYPVAISIPNIIRGESIRAAGKNITFTLDREFRIPELDDTVRIIVIGKFD